MTVLMSNTYLKEKGKVFPMQLRTGFVGCFETKELAMDVWNDMLLNQLSVPEDYLHAYEPNEIGATYVEVNEKGKWIDTTEMDYDEYYIIELMSKDTEMNKIWK